MAILCGTCAFADHHDFYPRRMPPGERLRYYAQYFPIVEIDSSFYGIPRPEVVTKWTRQVPSGFVFDIKAYRTLTLHDRGEPDLTRVASDAAAFERAVEPLANVGQLGVILLQFPPWFVRRGRHMDYVGHLRRRFAAYPVAVEFRHRSWWQDEVREDTLTWLRELDAVNVMCDEPQVGMGTIPFVPEVTHPRRAVFRLHGRNEVMWYETGLKSSQERFDYAYTREELAAFIPHVQRWAQLSEQVHILMNNNSNNDAVVNALDWLELLDLPRRERPVLMQTAQLTLFGDETL